ncbi:MAG TPA: hypothetical protein VLB02_02720, partial [Candidatus Paceibacterota bacterium]|nr:hypothetical protein [Candidatus Paceibacterota bacterium]
EQPASTTPGIVTFTGIIPGGATQLYDPLDSKSHELLLTQLLFTALQPGTPNFSIRSSDIRVHDGKGTPLAYIVSDQVVTTAPSVEVLVPDAIPPAPFAVVHQSASAVTRTPELIVFAAADAESGIARYEAKIGGSRWKPAQSPLALNYHALPLAVAIRAYDFSGNVQEERVQIPGSGFSGAAAAGGALLLFIIVLLRAMLSKRS